MPGQEQEGSRSGCTCFLCEAWEAFRKSETARHLVGMKREGLLALRSMLDWCIARTEEFQRKE